MRLSIAIAIASAGVILLFLLMANIYSSYAQSSIRTLGSFGTGDGQFRGPTAIIEDFGSKYLYVVDGGNNRI